MSEQKKKSEPKKQIVITTQATKFLLSLSPLAYADMMRAIEALSIAGRLAMPDAKKLDDNLFELRVRSMNLQNRAFYCYAIKGDVIYILSGFVKKTQKTPLTEIRKAKAIKRGLGL